MAQVLGPISLAPTGSTGNNSHAGAPFPAAAEHVEFQFVVEAVGGTPTVTFKFQGANVADGSLPGANDWFDLMVRPSDSDTGAVTRTVTAVGTYVGFLPFDRDVIKFVRVVTSANTNVTYSASAYGSDED